MSKVTKCAALFSLVGRLLNGGMVWAEQRFIDNGDGTVTDRKLSLMWAKTDNQADIFWQDARNWSKNEFPNTVSRPYDNWRLPTLSELQSLYVEDAKYDGYKTDCGYQAKMVPQIRITCIMIWSSETSLSAPMAFNFYSGSAFTIDVNENKGCRVLPVRSLK
jgi:hypothetical protein